MNISQLDVFERKRIKAIILNGHLTDKTNKREVVGKDILEIHKDEDFFKEMADYSDKIFKQL